MNKRINNVSQGTSKWSAFSVCKVKGRCHQTPALEENLEYMSDSICDCLLCLRPYKVVPSHYVFMLSICPFLRVHVSIWDIFSQYLWYALMDFLQSFLASASWDIRELISFGDHKVKGQGHSMTKCGKKYHFCGCAAARGIHSSSSSNCLVKLLLTV